MSETRVVVVTGGRNYNDRPTVFAALDDLAPTHLFIGDATGADDLAKKWASSSTESFSRRTPLMSYQVFRANWSKYGNAAGPIRNLNMLDAAEHEADQAGVTPILLSFPGGKGTAHCTNAARKRGFDVREVGRHEQG